jgi:hypothetical protein
VWPARHRRPAIKDPSSSCNLLTSIEGEHTATSDPIFPPQGHFFSFFSCRAAGKIVSIPINGHKMGAITQKIHKIDKKWLYGKSAVIDETN